jgi:predicted enzyme related to lactoylglutathione lyase
MANPVVHFEIMGTDGDKLRSFYSDLFGWNIGTMEGMDYGIVEAQDGVGIGGGIGADPAHTSSVTVYVAVDDLQSYLDRAVSMGGEVTQPVTEIPDVVTFAQFKDPQGNVIGLVKNQ